MENCPEDHYDPTEELDTTHIGRFKNLKIDEIKSKVEDYYIEEDEEEEEEEEDLEAALLVQMGYWKPAPTEPTPVALPNPEDINLVSAMKGSREKQGTEIEEKKVWWAPDVYDPVPKSPDDFYTGKVITPKIIDNKKGGGKNKQKMGKGGGGGKGGKGGKDKDKKQGKRHGGGASRRFNSSDDNEW